jgi:hypothetical protein
MQSPEYSIFLKIPPSKISPSLCLSEPDPSFQKKLQKNEEIFLDMDSKLPTLRCEYHLSVERKAIIGIREVACAQRL